MRLASMRYKDYVWPHNPRVYTIEYKRTMGARKVPFGRYHLCLLYTSDAADE